MVANDGFFQRPQSAAVLKHGILSRHDFRAAAAVGRNDDLGVDGLDTTR